MALLAAEPTGFWEAFWLMPICIPTLMIWGVALFDIFRRDDLSGGLRALWVVVVSLAPFFGTPIYLILRRPGATPPERQAIDTANRQFVQRYSPDTSTEQLQVLADLHDRGKLSDVEYTAEKARVLNGAGAGGRTR